MIEGYRPPPQQDALQLLLQARAQASQAPQNPSMTELAMKAAPLLIGLGKGAPAMGGTEALGAAQGLGLRAGPTTAAAGLMQSGVTPEAFGSLGPGMSGLEQFSPMAQVGPALQQSPMLQGLDPRMQAYPFRRF